MQRARSPIKKEGVGGGGGGGGGSPAKAMSPEKKKGKWDSLLSLDYNLETGGGSGNGR